MTMKPETNRPAPVYGLGTRDAYSVPRSATPTDLRLDGNEGRTPPLDVAEALGEDARELVRRYPDATSLEQTLAERFGVDAEQVLVTAGGDDAIFRLCTAMLSPEREIVLPVPTFEMIERYAALRGAQVQEVAWEEGAYPLAAVIEAVGERTAIIAVVSPNNPTGAVASADDLRRLSAATPRALLLVDLAYAEFAGEDLTAAALALPNALVVRTLSKAYGAAGLRVGYALGSREVIGWLRRAGNPYPVSGLSIATARRLLTEVSDETSRFLAQVREERVEIAGTIERLGGCAQESQANFVLARFPDAERVRDGLAGMGIAVRAFPARARLEDAVRITCPGDEKDLCRLLRALEIVLAPQAILFDVDGTLVDVSGSYRAATIATGREYGVEITADDVAEAQREGGGANDDWMLTRDLLARRGVERPLDEVIERFERIYQGTDEIPGLCGTERALLTRGDLECLRRRVRVGIVTGRPRVDADRFLAEAGFGDLVDTVVVREDAALKPSPEPLDLATRNLDVERAWYVGDTVDDMRAARAAGVLPIGVIAPGNEAEVTRRALLEAGAARVLDSPKDVEGLLS